MSQPIHEQPEILNQVEEKPEKKIEELEEDFEEPINRTRSPPFIRDVPHTQRNWEEWYDEEDELLGKDTKDYRPRITYLHAKSKKKIQDWLERNAPNSSHLKSISGCWKGYTENKETIYLEDYSDFTVPEDELKDFLSGNPLHQLFKIDYRTLSSCPKTTSQIIRNRFNWKIICSKNPPDDIQYEDSTENWNNYFQEVIDLN